MRALGVARGVGGVAGVSVRCHVTIMGSVTMGPLPGVTPEGAVTLLSLDTRVPVTLLALSAGLAAAAGLPLVPVHPRDLVTTLVPAVAAVLVSAHGLVGGGGAALAAGDVGVIHQVLARRGAHLLLSWF